jgi:hypothetical protein
MKVIIDGPDEFSDSRLLERKLDKLLSRLDGPVLVYAHKKGPWKHVADYAFRRRLTYMPHRPNKGRDSFAMDSVMHEEMCRDAKAIIVFGKGDKDLLRRAIKYGLKIKRVSIGDRSK